MTDKPGDLRVWWIPQVPMNPFRYSVPSVEVAKHLIIALAEYDKFQLDHNIKPDYCNAGGLEVFEDNEWQDYYDENGFNINEIIDGESE